MLAEAARGESTKQDGVRSLSDELAASSFWVALVQVAAEGVCVCITDLPGFDADSQPLFVRLRKFSHNLPTSHREDRYHSSGFHNAICAISKAVDNIIVVLSALVQRRAQANVTCANMSALPV